VAHYDYGGAQGLTEAIKKRKCFDHFNTEQQADIVEDYYLRVVPNDNTYPWRVFIDQVRANGACIWTTVPRPLPDAPTRSSDRLALPDCHRDTTPHFR
jgi:hypothetical protein